MIAVVHLASWLRTHSCTGGEGDGRIALPGSTESPSVVGPTKPAKITEIFWRSSDAVSLSSSSG